jgi:excisionase family DNA binding protein
MYDFGEWITAPEAARRLGVSERRVRQLCALGQLPARKVARDWVIHPTDVERFAELEPGRAGKPRKL